MFMKITFTDKILLFLAKMEDFRLASYGVKSGLQYVAGDPEMRKNYHWMLSYIKNRKKRKKIFDAVCGLKRRKIIQEIIKSNKKGYILTTMGKERLFMLRIKETNKKKMLKGRWLMVFFDIPEKERSKRDSLRKMLRGLGFEQMQKSIWICPYDVEKEVKEGVEMMDIGKYTQLLMVEKLF